jgi:hypothetical protein
MNNLAPIFDSLMNRIYCSVDEYFYWKRDFWFKCVDFLSLKSQIEKPKKKLHHFQPIPLAQKFNTFRMKLHKITFMILFTDEHDCMYFNYALK